LNIYLGADEPLGPRRRGDEVGVDVIGDHAAIELPIEHHPGLVETGDVPVPILEHVLEKVDVVLDVRLQLDVLLAKTVDPRFSRPSRSIDRPGR
jgi:hypothetical protein